MKHPKENVTKAGGDTETSNLTYYELSNMRAYMV